MIRRSGVGEQDEHHVLTSACKKTKKREATHAPLFQVLTILMTHRFECFPNRICNKADNNLRNESFNCHRRPPFRTKIFQSSHTTSNFSQRNKAVNNAIIYTPILFCKPGFYNICHLRLPRMPTLTAPIHRLIASDEAGEEAVATGCGGDGGGATTGTAERLVFRE